jgi:hypothetical protein
MTYVTSGSFWVARLDRGCYALVLRCLSSSRNRRGPITMSPRFGARLVVAITPDDVGRRVTTRRRDHGGFRDVVGVLESWSGGVLAVRKRDGTLVEIPEDTLAAAKVVPPL